MSTVSSAVRRLASRFALVGLLEFAVPSTAFASPAPHTLAAWERDACPPGVTTHRYTRGTNHFVVWQHQRHIKRAELSVKLARGHQRIRMPTCTIIHGNFRKPLGEIIAASTASLTSRHRGGTRFPRERHVHGVAWR